MDVIIPAHNIKILSSSIATLSKIGKILYIEFDPLDGLTVRALNDAKSSFVYFHFEVGFFERCTSSPSTANYNNGTGNTNTSVNSDSGRQNNNNNNNNKRKKKKRVQEQHEQEQHSGAGGGRSKFSRKRSLSSSGRKLNNTNSNNQNTNCSQGGDEKYLCKVPIKTIASILRPRKGVTSLRISSSNHCPVTKHHNNRNTNRNTNDKIDHDDNDDNEEEEEQIGARMLLSFEYQIQSDGIMRVLHKVGVSNADGIIAIAPKQNCSEIITSPDILLTMLDQVKSTSEVALTVNDATQKVIASSFHYGDALQQDGSNTSNIMLNATNAAILKTETSIDCHEFEEFHFMDDGAVQNVLEREEEDRNNNSRTGNGTSSSLPPPPEGVSEQITLVFSIKEAKAMLQFCSSSQSYYDDHEEARAIVSFYWGGRPIIIETEGESFRGELILATVDHSLLSGIGGVTTN